MTERQTTVMVLVPGRNAISIVVPRSPRATASLAVLLPLLTGVVSQRVLTADSQSIRSAAHVAMGSVGNVSPVMTVSTALRDRLAQRRSAQHPAADSVTTSVQGAVASQAPRDVAPDRIVPAPGRACPGPAEPALALAEAATREQLALAEAATRERPALAGAEQAAAPAELVAPAQDLTAALALAVPAPEPAHDALAVPPPSPDAIPAPEAARAAQPSAADHDGRAAGATIDVKTMLRTLASLRRGSATPDDVSHIPSSGLLRLQALHLGESIAIHPFNEQHEPNPDDMAQLSHAMRCRVTGAEISIDPKLVEILVRLHALYGREIQLISGHRQPHTIGTKPTSQHTLGRAADIRIPGVSIEELKRVALSLGARGVGLYPEKGFVHVDVRQQPRYTWVYTAARGEQSDVRLANEAAARKALAAGATPLVASAESEAEVEPENHEAESDVEQ